MTTINTYLKFKSTPFQLMTYCLLFLIFSGCNYKKNKEEGILEVKQNKYALLIGMARTKVKGFSNVATMSASSNVNRIRKILKKEDFTDIETLNSPNDKEFLDNLNIYLDKLESNDFLVIYYFGHGGQIEDDTTGYDNESDDLDETFVSYNRQIRDDEINKILKSKNTSSKVLFIVDACNSESMHTLSEEVEHLVPIDDDFKINLIYLGATADGKRIPPDTFSKIISKVWKKGKFKGNYLDFHDEIEKKASNVRGMNPKLDIRWADEEFINQRPFNTD